MSDNPTHGAPAPFPAGFGDKIARNLRARVDTLDDDESLTITGELAHGYALVSLALENDARTSRLSIDVAVECEPNDIDSPLDARAIAIDYLDAVFADYMEVGRQLSILPDWDAHEVSGVMIKVRGQVLNPIAEEAAAEFLAKHGFADDGGPLEPRAGDGERE